MTNLTVATARAAGFTIDDSCYPHFAYKGSRFNPTTWTYLATETETELAQEVADLQRQLATEIAGRVFWREKAIGAAQKLAEVTRERDTLKAMVDLHDAMNDRRRAQANETPFKRRTYENG